MSPGPIEQGAKMLSCATIALATAFGMLGCGGPATQLAVAERFESPAAERARELVPDLFGAAEAARSAAQAASDADRRDEAEDESTRARMLLNAAIAEADRIELEESRLAVEAQVRELEQQVARDEVSRSRVTAQLAQDEAARIAEQQAAAAFERAVNDEGRRSGDQTRLFREAAAILRRRARLLGAAARALGAPPDRLEPVEAALAASEGARSPSDTIDRADEAVRAALSALGAARGDRVGGDQRQPIIDAANEAGFEVEQRDLGLAVRAGRVFSGRSTRTGRGGQRILQRLAAMARAVPGAPLQVHGFADRERPSAVARAEAARAALVAAGVDESRIEPFGVSEDGADGAAVELLFLGIAPTP